MEVISFFFMNVIYIVEANVEYEYEGECQVWATEYNKNVTDIAHSLTSVDFPIQSHSV